MKVPSGAGTTPQTNIKTPHIGKLYDRRICKLEHETKTFKNKGYEMALVERQGGAWST